MRKFQCFFILLFSISTINAQELNCKIVINHDQISGSNKQVYATLEKALNEFVNETKWTNREVDPIEKVNCVMAINVNAQPSLNTFNASIQVQSSRPVFGTSYASPILNLKDDDFDFTYKEFEPLQYNENSFDSNLISTIVFYVYVVLGVDADTFAKKGGQKYLEAAQNVMLQAQQSGIVAWSNQVGKPNRFLLIDNLLSSKLQNFRTTLYAYHREGFDRFLEEPKKAKQRIENSIISLESLYNKSIGNYLIRVFFDAKSSEIVNLYSDTPTTKNKTKLLSVLNRISSGNTSIWKNIKR